MRESEDKLEGKEHLPSAETSGTDILQITDRVPLSTFSSEHSTKCFLLRPRYDKPPQMSRTFLVDGGTNQWILLYH